jgi:hypothetical protein
MRRILFLDFDGVLHPQHESGVCPFGYMDNFCQLMRDTDPAGRVEIVISSTWRLQETLEELRAHFPPDVAARIIGVTPHLPPPPHARRGSRQREIESWMAQHAPDGAWLAVDDIALYFDIDCPHLFLVDEDIPPGQTATTGAFSIMAEIEERERLTALWQSRGLGINLRVARGLRSRLQTFLAGPGA